MEKERIIDSDVEFYAFKEYLLSDFKLTDERFTSIRLFGSFIFDLKVFYLIN